MRGVRRGSGGPHDGLPKAVAVDVTSPEGIVGAYAAAGLLRFTGLGAAIAWWENLTAKGGEGMVVKPLTFMARGRRGLTQPALKCRVPST